MGEVTGDIPGGGKGLKLLGHLQYKIRTPN